MNNINESEWEGWRGHEGEWDQQVPENPVGMPAVKPSESSEEDKIIAAIRDKHKSHQLKSDDVLDLYAKAKELRSNKLLNLVKQLSQLLKEEKKARMKTELMEYLVRACVREVLDQTQGAPINASGFHQDSQGVWCKECGNKGTAIKLPNGSTAYSCNNTTCRAHRNLMRQGRLEEGKKSCVKCKQSFSAEHPEDDYCPSCGGTDKEKVKVKPFVKGRGFTPKIKKVDEGEEADSMDDQDQELQADRDQKGKDETKPKSKKPAKIGEQDKGATAPPGEGQGTADQPAVPKDEPTDAGPEGEKPTEEPPEETPPPSTDLKGIKLINPRNKAKLIDQGKLLRPGDDAMVERTLYKIAATLAGSQAKVALSTMRLVKDALKSPTGALYLYLGKYDPNSDEIFLMADKSLQVAKDSSIGPEEMTGSPVGALAPGAFDPRRATDPELIKRAMAQSRGEYGTRTPRYGIDESLRGVIKKAVNEILNKDS